MSPWKHELASDANNFFRERESYRSEGRTSLVVAEQCASNTCRHTIFLIEETV